MVATDVVHQVRRVGGHEHGLRVTEEASYVLFIRCVTAEEAVVAEEPEAARLGDGV
jgi:hypothetical protein